MTSTPHDPRYLGYFACFAHGDYFEAHDVLEQLWLGVTGPERDFYKGLIQVAGAFVHMHRQRERPAHPKDGCRLRPAARLLARARFHLAPFAPAWRGLRVAALCEVCARIELEIVRGGFVENPLENHGTPPLDFAALFSNG
jgi:hypothetical protein